MDIKSYLRPLIKYWWLLGLATLVAVISSAIVTWRQLPVYQARTTLVIGRAVYEPNPSANDLYLGQQLAGFYADIGNRDNVRTATQEALGLNALPPYNVHTLPNSQMLEIVVTDSNPKRAMAVANELANQLIKQTPTNQGGGQQSHQEFIDQQLNQLEQGIKDTNSEIAKKQDELTNLNSASQIADVQQQLAALNTKLNNLQTNYASLLNNSQQGAQNTLSIIESAGLPRVPIGPNKSMIILLSAAIALAIAAGAAYLLEFLDNTVQSPDEIARLTGSQIIGFLSDIGKDDFEGIYVAKNPRSALAEAYRSLRTNLDFMAINKPVKSILITSSGIGEGKTTVSANLATILAQGGKKVAIIDADMRRPRLHKLFGFEYSRGLSDIFLGKADIQDAITVCGDEKIMVVPSGETPPNPTDLISSGRMATILDILKESVDIVIVDGPPFLVADAALLSSKVDGVLLVVRYGHSLKSAIREVIDQLKFVEARVLGVAINSLPKSIEDYGQHYRYYDTVYDEEEAEGKPGPKRRGGPLTSIGGWLSRNNRSANPLRKKPPSIKDSAHKAQ
jgi:succinoglycan biosynthesis transport protein ExoP